MARPVAHRSVFVSSTSKDLVAYRAAVRDVLAELGYFALGMEAFGAWDADATAASLEAVAQAEIAPATELAANDPFPESPARKKRRWPWSR